MKIRPAAKGLLAVLFLCARLSFVWAEDYQTATDKYYAGLAKIITAYRKDPQKCVLRVEAYLKRNKKLLEKVKLERKESLIGGSPAQDTAADDSAVQTVGLSGQDKFYQAMEKLSSEHISEGLEIMSLNMRALLE